MRCQGEESIEQDPSRFDVATVEFAIGTAWVGHKLLALPSSSPKD
jgi:hypothetical protein